MSDSNNKHLITQVIKNIQGSSKETEAPSAQTMEDVPMKEGAEQDDSYAMEAVAEDMMAAFQSNDGAGLIAALKAFMDLYK